MAIQGLRDEVQFLGNVYLFQSFVALGMGYDLIFAVQQIDGTKVVVLGLDEIPKPDDAADALAVAITCSNSLSYLKLTE